MNKIISFLLSMTLFLAFFSGCKNFDDLENAEITSSGAEFAVPLASTKTSLQDLLENFDDLTTIEIGPDGLFTLRYFGEVVARTSREIIDDALKTLPPVIPVIDTVFVLPFESPNELEVDIATMSKGRLSYGFLPPNNTSISKITISLPQAIKNGESLVIEHTFPFPLPGADSSIVGFVDLVGYQLIPEDGNLNVIYDARDQNGNRVTMAVMILYLVNPDFSYIEGFLGGHTHEGERDTIQIEFFESWIQGDVYFEDPKVWVHVQNSFGIPTRSEIEVFQVYTALGGTEKLESDVIGEGKGIDFVYPELDHVGDMETMSFPFNTGNSNIDDVLGSKPVALDYLVNAITNPDGNANIRGFLTDSSFYRVQVEVELPIYGRATGFGAVDTFDLDFSSYTDVKYVEFKVVSENQIPLDIEMQFYFTDENGSVIDSLLQGKERIIQAAPVNAEGIVIDPSNPQYNEIFVMIDAAKFDRLRDASNIILNAFFSTIDNGETSVKVFNTQEVEIRMGMKIGTM